MPPSKTPKLVKTEFRTYKVADLIPHYNAFNEIAKVFKGPSKQKATDAAFERLGNLIDISTKDVSYDVYVLMAHRAVDDILHALSVVLSEPQVVDYDKLRKGIEIDYLDHDFAFSHKDPKTFECQVKFKHFPTLVKVGQIAQGELILQGEEMPDWSMGPWLILRNTAAAFPPGLVSVWRRPMKYFTDSEVEMGFGIGNEILVTFGKVSP